MKKVLSVLLILCFCFSLMPISAFQVKAASVDDLFFQLNSDGESYSIVGFNADVSGEFILPETYNNKPVTVIKSEAFKNCSKLTNIVIPDSVTSIGSGAFSGCSGLTSITIPFVGGYATATYDSEYTLFGYIFGTSRYTGGTSTEQYYSSSSYSYSYYYIPKTLKSVTVTGGKLFYGAFYNCSNLTEITIGDGVTYIGDCAFYYCSNLTEITIGDGVTYIGTDAFYGCKLSKISVSEDNSYYSSDSNGSLYDKAKTRIIKVSIDVSGSYIIPNSVTRIYYEAFKNCSKLTNIVIPDSVTSIGSGAFSGCSGLTSITIPFVGGSATATYDSEYTLFGYIFGTSRYTGGTSTEQYYSSSSYSYSYYYIPKTLKSVTVTGGKLFYGAFYNCSNLTEITISDRVTSIGTNAFYGCSSLNKVYYLGSKSDRESMSIADGNSNLTTATWYYDPCAGTAGHSYDDCYDLICNVCQKQRESAHDYKWVIDKEATCSSNGLKHEECSVCLLTRNENTAIIVEHTYNNTCDTDCNVCGAVRTIIHNYQWIIDKQATCFSAGLKHEECSVCKAVRNLETEIPALEQHTYNNACDTDCNVCGAVRTIIHNYQWVIDKQATCVPGLKHEECSVCKAVRNLETEIPASAQHTYSYVCDEVCDGCSQKRTTTHTFTDDFDTECNVCKQTRSIDPKTVTKNGFTYTITPSASGGIVSITKCETSVSGIVTVPSKIEGCKVTSVSANAFKDCKKITKLTIPDTVTSIGDATLSGCSNLLELKIPFLSSRFSYLFGSVQYGEVSNENVPVSLKKVTITGGEIPNYAFKDCTNIGEIVLGDKVTSVGKGAFTECVSITRVIIGNGTETIGEYAFADCVSLAKLIIGSGTKKICEFAFQDCVSLNDLTLGKNITNICESAFSGCYRLEVVTLPTKLEEIGDNAFYGCSSLKKIAIPNATKLIGNYAFASCSSITSVTLGNSVTTIFRGAFSGCSNLKEIVIPVATTGIGKSVFSNCYSLTKVIWKGHVDQIDISTFSNCYNLKMIAIPKNIRTIASDAFSGCNSLKEVWYEGSKTQRDKISISGGNNAIKNATWYYNKFDPNSHFYSTTITKATTSKDGSIVKKCDFCGKFTKTVIKYAKTFELSAKSYTYSGGAKKPTVKIFDSAGKLVDAKNYTVAYKNNKNVGKASVVITFKNYYTGTKTVYFTINPKPTTISKVTGAKKSVKVNIKKQTSQVTGYQIQYSTSKKFSSSKMQTISSYKTTSYTIKSLKAKKTYYVRVRTYKKVGNKTYYSDWSDYKSVKTK